MFTLVVLLNTYLNEHTQSVWTKVRRAEHFLRKIDSLNPTKYDNGL